MMKKINCLLIIVAMLVSACCFAADTDATQKDSDTNQMSDYMLTALDVLRTLEIIPDFYDYNLIIDEEVTRGDFAYALGQLIKTPKINDKRIYYYDVPETYYAYDAICTLTEMGAINGTAANVFEPDKPIEVAAVCKILLKLLGYDIRAEYTGGYPTGYLNVARGIGILDNAELKTNILGRGDMISILYETIKVPKLTATEFSDADGDKYIADEKITLLSENHRIHYAKGFVEGSEMISLYDSNGLLENTDEVFISGTKFDTLVNLSNMLGEEIEYFYFKQKLDDPIEKGVIKWAKRRETSKTIAVYMENVGGFDKNSYVFSYYKNGKSARLTLKRGLALIYNGRAVDRGIDEILNRKDCDFKFIDSGKGFDTVIANSYVNYVVESINLSSKIIYDAEISSRSVTLDPEKYYYVGIVDGVTGDRLAFEDIKPGQVLSIYQSLGSDSNKYILAKVVDGKKTGTIEGTKKIGKKPAVIVDGMEYISHNSYKFPELKVGDNAEIYIDIKGYVVLIKTSSNDFSAAYIIDYDYFDDSAFEKTFKIKLLNQNGVVEILDVAEKVEIDGARGRTVDELKRKLDSLEIVETPARTRKNYQLIRIKKNKDNKILAVDTPITEERNGETIENSLTRTMQAEAGAYWSDTGSFTPRNSGKDGSKGDTLIPSVLFDSSTVFFCIPNESWNNLEDTDYTVGSKALLRNETNYTLSTYRIGDEMNYEDFVVYEITDRKTDYYSRKGPLLVTGIGKVLNAQGDPIDCVYGWQGAAEISMNYNGEKDITTLKEGTLIEIKFDTKGLGYDYSVLFDPYNPTHTDVGTGDNYWNNYIWGNYRIEVGSAKRVKGNKMLFGGAGATPDRLLIQPGSGAVVFDKNKTVNPVSIGTFGDALTEENSETPSTIVTWGFRTSSIKMVIIYK